MPALLSCIHGSVIESTLYRGLDPFSVLLTTSSHADLSRCSSSYNHFLIQVHSIHILTTLTALSKSPNHPISPTGFHRLLQQHSRSGTIAVRCSSGQVAPPNDKVPVKGYCAPPPKIDGTLCPMLTDLSIWVSILVMLISVCMVQCLSWIFDLLHGNSERITTTRWLPLYVILLNVHTTLSGI